MSVFSLVSFALTSNAQSVTTFILVNAATDQDIGTLNDGDVVNLSLTGSSLNVRANTDGSVGRVDFQLSGQESFNPTESVAPYTLFGDSLGNYNNWTPVAGNYQLTATPYAPNETVGKPLTVSFSVVLNADEPPPDSPESTDGDGTITFEGDTMQWHRFDLKMAAKGSTQNAIPNPFMDYRFNVTFTSPTGKHYVVPGYFAGDGDGGSSGNVWIAHLNPHETGEWTYTVSFREGSEVAVDLDPVAGSAVTPFDNATGTFMIQPSDKTGKDFRAPDKGMLTNRGYHYLTYGGSGKPFLYAGPGIPENILGYRGFTNTTIGIGHEFEAHLKHWKEGDPDWDNGEGKQLIGALNYIADNGANCLYMMSNTIGGDGRDVFPHPTSETTKDRYDLLKLKQWDIALAHGQKMGIFLHWHLSENEKGNYQYYGGNANGGSLTSEKKLSFRMHNAVFGHYNALKWNLAEEIEWVTAERTAQIAYLKAVDPYDHPVTYQAGGAGLGHDTFQDHYADLNMDGASIQASGNGTRPFNVMQEHRDASAEVGNPWTCSWDEPQTIENDLNDDERGYPNGRRRKMWPAFMGGGDGFMWYIQKDGGGHGFDQRIEDFSIMQSAFNWSGHVLAFMDMLPVMEMSSSLNIVDSRSGTDYTLYKEGEIYAIFNDDVGRDMEIDLSDHPGAYDVRWYDPRNGGALQMGTVATITVTSGEDAISLGSAPKDTDQDWAILLRKVADQYTDWSIGFTTAPTGDENGDGIANLVAYAVGAEPDEPAQSFLPRLEHDGANPAIVIDQSDKTDVTYEVLSSLDLQEWTVVAQKQAGDFSFSLLGVSGITLTTFGNQVRVVDSRDEPRRFYRLRIRN